VNCHFLFQLLKTQADLQKTQSDLTEQRDLAKGLSEQNSQLKAENETILRNLDRDTLHRTKFEAEHANTIDQISNLQRQIQQKEESLTESRSSLEESSKQVSALKKHGTICYIYGPDCVLKCQLSFSLSL